MDIIDAGKVNRMPEFEMYGFEMISDVLSSAACDELIKNISKVSISGAGTRTLLDEEWCGELANSLKLHLQIAPHLPQNAVAVQCTLFDKSVDRNWYVSLHQDVSIPVREKVDHAECRGWSRKEGTWFVIPPDALLSQVLAVRVHLDECEAENGPLRVIPGSHRNGRLSESDFAKLRAESPEVECLTPRGSALLMHPLLLHASSKAKSPAPRRVLHFLFGPPELPCGLRWHCAV